MTKLFVYGTLMRGESNHRLLTGARFLGERTTEARYTLVDLGYFPALVDGGTTAIRGESYEVDDQTLAAVDRLEGHPRYYERRAVTLAAGEHAEAYFMPVRENRQSIDCGDWRAHDLAKRRVECDRCIEGVDWTGDDPVMCTCRT